MEIQQEDNQTKGRFYTEDGRAEITYSWSGTEEIVIHHTEVDDSLQGQGIGKKLVLAVLDWAKAKNLKVVPMCSYASSVISRMNK